MDSLNYYYYPDKNQVNHITDILGISNNYPKDLDTQPGNNYTFDAIGQLTHDTKEEIQENTWDRNGRLVKTTRTGGSQRSQLEYEYDAMGYRISQTIKPYNRLDNPTYWTTTYFSRDASGNVLAVYTKKEGESDVTLTEYSLYGSSRLGTQSIDKTITALKSELNDTLKRKVGMKFYEIPAYNGNVTSVVTDIRIPLNDPLGTANVACYKADLRNYYDYYCGVGMLMPERNGTLNPYRYGAQGSLLDAGFEGDDRNHITTYYREGNLESMVWWSVDPMSNKTPGESPYMLMSGNPIMLVDPRGDSTKYFYKGKEILKTYDKLANAVVDFSKIDESKMKYLLAGGQYIKDNSTNLNEVKNTDKFNKYLRSFGESYFVDEYKAFFNENNNDYFDKTDKNEHGSFLVFNNGEYHIAKGVNIKGVCNSVDPFGTNPDRDVKTQKTAEQLGFNGRSPFLHTHPNSNSNSGDNDDSRIDPPTRSYMIIVNQSNIIFYGRDPIKLSKSNTFK